MTAINAEASELLAELFNRMPIKELQAVPEPLARRVGEFMVANGYRMVFNRWYKQADPDAVEAPQVQRRRLYKTTNGRYWLPLIHHAHSDERYAVCRAAERSGDVFYLKHTAIQPWVDLKPTNDYIEGAPGTVD
jgi:hypothetical protein